MGAHGIRRTVAVVAVATGCLVLAACTMPVTSAPEQPASPSPGQLVAAFYGDSYTRGTGASSPEHRWSSIVAAERGWFEFNPSVDGLGYVINRGFAPGGDLVGQIVDHDPPPDVVIVTMGLNDAFLAQADAEELEAAIRADFERFREELPDSRLVVVEPFWHQEERPSSLRRIIGWVRDAAADVGADHIAGVSRWIEGHPEWMSADTVHPNDDGYAEIARRMSSELERLGL